MQRRSFLQSLPAALAFSRAANAAEPWYKRTFRWAQTNITEADTTRYDIAWWRAHWKRTEVQGVIINAGGIYAYYPSKFPLHHRAKGLGDRDLYGELAAAAHQDGLAVLARMDSNRTHEPFYKAHPDWFARDADGKPYRTGEHYVTCINSPYYDEYLSGVLREIVERSHPEGFTDNSWSGLERNQICYCANCERRFRDHSGKPVPRKHDWDDPAYRQWIKWNYARRLELWDFNNRVTKAAGGPHCLWLGMQSGSITSQARKFRDFKEICVRSEIVMLDHQARNDADGFQHNAEAGKLIHGLLGHDKLIPESIPMYQMGRPTFRHSSKPAPEARMWMVSGFAGGIQPWWHHIGAVHEDRRMYRTAEPVMRWHKLNERYLVNRTPVATVGVVWSQTNTDFYGRDDASARVEQPWRGFMHALIRARIPCIAVHADHIARDAAGLAVLVLPNIGALSDAQVQATRKFAAGGGAIVATGETSLYTDDGDPRPDFALADLFGVRGGKPRPVPRGTLHTYLRITPDSRHAALANFDETGILPFGEDLAALEIAPDGTVPLTFVPEFPIFPPESAWMREPKTNTAGLVLREAGKSRVAFLPASLDRQYAIHHLPDHGDLLANLVRWAANGRLPLQVQGRGMIDCHLYAQRNRRVLHVVNLGNPQPWSSPLEDYAPAGPFRIRVQLPAASSCRLLVSGRIATLRTAGGWAEFEIPNIEDHEVAVLE
jgi:hypothetical protein